MKRISYLIAALVFVVDQLVKHWILNGIRLPEIESVEILPFLSLTYVQNRGVSMGMLTAGSDIERWSLVALTGLIAVVVAFWIRRERKWPESIALGLVLGGALGNIVDRIRFGYVVDFVHLHAGPWSFYVFNVADAAISVGVAILLVRALMSRSDSGRSDGKRDRLHDA